jgi:cystathionine beta-synthase
MMGGTVMDVLLVIEAAAVPERLSARTRRRVDVAYGELRPETIADLRAHIPRLIGLIAPDNEEGRSWLVRIADQLHRAGLPVEVLSDRPLAVAAGIAVSPIVDPQPAIEAADSLIDLIGNTPLVRLDRIGRTLPGQLLAKLEFLNPGGSVKDRPALAMVEAAELEGKLKPGGTIVEPTSGNTGVGLAIVAARRGYRCIFTMPDKIGAEKVALLRAYGAEVVVCPTAVEPEHPDSYYSVARRLVETTPDAFQPDQYSNLHNPEAHFLTTGPEIWRQTAGRITHLVASIGTGGTISGVGRYLKAQNRAVQIIGADPEGSVYSGGSGRPYLVEGIGEDFWPAAYDREIADKVVMVSDRDSFLTARRVTREEGILVGGSAGTAIWAAVQVGLEADRDAVIVVIVPDSGRGYLSKLYDDSWMSDYGFLRSGGSSGDSVSELLAYKERSGAPALPPLVHVHPHETVREAISILREYGVSQMPVVKAEPPLALAEVVGTVTEHDLLARLVGAPDSLDARVDAVMAAPLPMVGTGEAVEVAATRLARSSAVLVVDGGHPTGIVTRSDLLDFLSGAGG